MFNWDAWKPDGKTLWNLRRVNHLHRRAGYGATWSELQRDLKDGPEKSLNRVLNGSSRGKTEGYESLVRLIGNAAVDSTSVDRLKAWWFYQLLLSPDPLTERLAVMWHNHFATSSDKVGELPALRAQNETLRRHARGPFKDLLGAVMRDPALLEYLDAPANRKGHPNENLARELMELFTLGIGHYSEKDVTEAARALTGWTVRQGRFVNVSRLHDGGEKLLLGKRGTWAGDDLLQLLLTHPATAERLAWRLTSEFFGEGVVAADDLKQLAAILRKNNLNVGAAVETILRSRLFWSEKNVGSRVADPVSFVLGPLRALELFADPPGTLILAGWARRMGQDLFTPPNVGGWPGGRNWLSTRTVIARTNYVTALVGGRLHNPVAPPPLDNLCEQYRIGSDLETRVDFLAKLFYGGLSAGSVRAVVTAARQGEGRSDARLHRATQLLLTLPESHLH